MGRINLIALCKCMIPWEEKRVLSQQAVQIGDCFMVLFVSICGIRNINYWVFSYETQMCILP